MKFLISFLIVILASFNACASELKRTQDLYDKNLEELFYIETEIKADVGSRSGKRDAILSEVPIDVITAEQIRNSGYTELSKVIQMLLPGFNYPRPSITDGTDHARPFTLRGLTPDQVLVLINGKRLHHGSLLHVNGTIGYGTSSVDLNTIPVAAVEKIEILRDGAAAQYGSDAIAGVINIILKGYGENSEISGSAGVTREGDGKFRQGSVFYSYPTKYDGFINLTAEIKERDETNRAGLDRRMMYPEGDVRNNNPPKVTFRFGDPHSKDILLALNSELVSERGITYYGSGIFNYRESEGGAFFRLPIDFRNNPNIYPDGFLPLIAPEILDYSLTVGAKGEIFNKTSWDLSFTHGYNDFHFYVNNSLNSSLGDQSPTSFDCGGTKYMQNILNLSTNTRVSPKFNLSSGAEVRREDYEIYRGDRTSYILGDPNKIAGAQGFPGFQPENEVSEHRYNIGAYIDLRYDILKNLQAVLATRYENYSDFGDTLNEKIALSYKPFSSLLLRSSLSTGFRAPSLSQIYYTATRTVSSGDLRQSGHFSVTSPVARALGAKDLIPEESKHFSAGLVYEPNSNFSFSVDYFYTYIDDRIIMANPIYRDISDEVAKILDKYRVEEASFFTNLIDTKTWGWDFRFNYKKEFSKDNKFKFALMYHKNKNTVEKVKKAPSILGKDGEKYLIDDYIILTYERAQPEDYIKIFTQYTYGDATFTLNINRFGEYSSIAFDKVVTFDAKWTVDVQAEYELKKGLKFAIGAKNLFDTYPDKWGEYGHPVFGRDKIIQYTQFSPFGFNGAFYYLRTSFSF